MQTIQRVTGTFVRHNWKEVTEGVATGKTYIVENHGKQEAAVVSPKRMEVTGGKEFDLDAYFARLKNRPKLSLKQINQQLARSPEL